MRVWAVCSIAAIAIMGVSPGFASQSTTRKTQAAPSLQTTPSSKAGQTAPAAGLPAASAPSAAGAAAPMSDEDKANALSDQIGKLMVKCMNLLSAEDPLSIGYCKQQSDLADQYPGHLRIVDRVLAHDEYGIALAAFDHTQEALTEFNKEIALLPEAVKPGTLEWSTAYWHRAMIYRQMGEKNRADRDYRAAEASFRKQEHGGHPDSKMKTVLRQHAALLEAEGKTAAAQRILAEAGK